MLLPRKSSTYAIHGNVPGSAGWPPITATCALGRRAARGAPFLAPAAGGTTLLAASTATASTATAAARAREITEPISAQIAGGYSPCPRGSRRSPRRRGGTTAFV